MPLSEIPKASLQSGKPLAGRGDTDEALNLLKSLEADAAKAGDSDYEAFLAAVKSITERLRGADAVLTVERVREFNRHVPEKLTLAEGVMPDRVRTHSVLVGNVYHGAPAELNTRRGVSWADCASNCVIRDQQWDVTWRSFVPERLRDESGAHAKRQRHLVLDLSAATEPVPAGKVRELTPRLARDYADQSPKTLQRDLAALEELGLIER